MSTADHDLLELVERLGRVLSRAQRGEATGLRRIHLHALAYLRDANRYSNTPGALAEFLGLSKGTVSQSLLVLERRGLVERSRDETDARQVRLRLTRRGARLAERGALEARWTRALAGIPAADRVAAAAVLRRALVDLQRGGELSFGLCRTCRHFRREGGDAFRCGLTGEPLRPAETEQVCREHAWPEGG